MLWGAFSCYVNAVGALFGKVTHKHIQLVRVAKQLALERKDPAMFEQITQAERLHANFYHNFMTEEDFAKHYSVLLEFLKKLSEELNRRRAHLNRSNPASSS